MVKIHKWADLKKKYFTAAQIAEMQRKARAELLEMDLETLREDQASQVFRVGAPILITDLGRLLGVFVPILSKALPLEIRRKLFTRLRAEIRRQFVSRGRRAAPPNRHGKPDAHRAPPAEETISELIAEMGRIFKEAGITKKRALAALERARRKVYGPRRRRPVTRSEPRPDESSAETATPRRTPRRRAGKRERRRDGES